MLKHIGRVIFKRIAFSLSLFCGVFLLSTQAYSESAFAEPSPVLAIIIDDIGDNRQQGLAAINLPGAISYAFLPHTPYSVELAKLAHSQGKEVMLHAPMENKAGLRLGPGAMTRDLSGSQLKKILHEDFDVIPHAVGMNNHMGSLLTEDREKMQQVMTVMQQRKMFFLDSVTTSKTVAWKVAREYGIPYLVRDVFLDNEPNWQAIHEQFKRALKIAMQQRHAVLIGHPYPETVAYLEKALPVLDQLGIRLVSASELLRQRSQHQLMLAQPSVVDPCDTREGHCAGEPMAARLPAIAE